MSSLAPHLSKAIDIAAAFVARELGVQQRLNPEVTPDEIWASVRFDGTIVVGHPLLRAGQGLYVDRLGQWREP
jgi:hypothetical protein